MLNATLTAEEEKKIRYALRASWPTQSAFFKQIPSLNMCRQTSVVVCEHFGGDILRTEVRTVHGDPVEHFYNLIGGRSYDFTREQFLSPDFCNPLVPPGTRACITDVAGPVQIDLPRMRSAFSLALRSYSAAPAAENGVPGS